MNLAADARTLRALLRGAGRGLPHAERLERFYAPQAADYDRYRERLLHGRAALAERLPAGPGARLVELGAGTGGMLDLVGTRAEACARVDLVDLCPSLLAVARARHAGRRNVHVHEADATTWRPESPATCVYFSYSLSMIPDWRAAIDNAIAMLARGGTLGVADFYVSAPRPSRGRARHGLLTRTLWPRMFAHDGVRLSPEPLDYLESRLEAVEIRERRGPLPYLPGLSVPWFVLLGTTAETPS